MVDNEIKFTNKENIISFGVASQLGAIITIKEL